MYMYKNTKSQNCKLFIANFFLTTKAKLQGNLKKEEKEKNMQEKKREKKWGGGERKHGREK